MNKLLIIIILVSSMSYGAPLSGITETGDEVVLRDDGTWSYVNPSEVEVAEMEVNPVKFTKPMGNTFPVKSSKNNTQAWINAKKWAFKKGDKDPTEYEFTFKGEDLYGMMINESIEMEIEFLAQVALENARDAAPDAKIIHKEYRYVNGAKVIFMQMACTISGMKITYLGYYYSDASGTTQLIAYTGTSAVEKFRLDIEEFLNGLVAGGNTIKTDDQSSDPFIPTPID